MAGHREPPPYRDHVFYGRLPAIESVCRGERRSSSGVASADAATYATPTHTTDVLAVRQRQVLQLIAQSDATPAIPVRSGIGEHRSAASGNS
jgi:hypothetical protein